MKYVVFAVEDPFYFFPAATLGDVPSTFADACLRTRQAAANARDFLRFNPQYREVYEPTFQRENATLTVGETKKHKAAIRRHYLDRPVEEIGESEFANALDRIAAQGVEIASFGGVVQATETEPEYGTFCRQYAKLGGRFWSKIVDASDRKTWLKSLWVDRPSVFARETVDA